MVMEKKKVTNLNLTQVPHLNLIFFKCISPALTQNQGCQPFTKTCPIRSKL